MSPDPRKSTWFLQIKVSCRAANICVLHRLQPLYPRNFSYLKIVTGLRRLSDNVKWISNALKTLNKPFHKQLVQMRNILHKKINTI